MALVEIAAFQDPIAASLARGRLESEGISAILFDAGLASLGLGSMTPARLMVEESDREAATRLISEAEEGQAG